MMSFCSDVLFSSLRQDQRSSIKVKDEHLLFSRTKNKEHKKKKTENVTKSKRFYDYEAAEK